MSDIIKLLPDNVANQIAAGEVVQRPSSVVKELLENSIDSGADSIHLTIKDAGRTIIQVVDNGVGMSKKDAVLCFERHSTSKIQSANDLFNLSTKGFRGEALASIAAISHVELITKIISDELGTSIKIKANKIYDNKPVVSNKGTSISVKNLFCVVKDDVKTVPAKVLSFKIVSLDNEERFNFISFAKSGIRDFIFSNFIINHFYKVSPPTGRLHGHNSSVWRASNTRNVSWGFLPTFRLVT